MVKLSDDDRQRVAAAIAAAESTTNGEIVAVATPISDPYHDVALHWALIPLFAVLAWAAWAPTALVWWYDFLFGGWQPDPTMSQLFTLLMVFAALKFTVALLILKWMPLRLALTPGATKHRRVRRRAVAIFQAAAAGPRPVRRAFSYIFRWPSAGRRSSRTKPFSRLPTITPGARQCTRSSSRFAKDVREMGSLPRSSALGRS